MRIQRGPPRLSEPRKSTNSNQRRWWDLFGKRQPESVVERLKRNLESWGSRNKGMRAGVQMHSAPATQLSSTLLSEKVTGFCARGGDGELGGVIRAADAEQGGS